MKSSNEQVCRLCFSCGSDHVDIFNGSASDSTIAEVIVQHFQFEVIESDYFPNTVCIDCWTKTYSFHEFYRFVQLKRDKVLKKLFQDCENDEFTPSCGILSAYTGEYDAGLDTEPTLSILIEEPPQRHQTHSLENKSESGYEGIHSLNTEQQIDIKVECVDDASSSYVVNSDAPWDKTSNEDTLKPSHISQVSSVTKELIIDKHFDMACDHCDVHFETLENAQFHYTTKHNIEKGYIKCCKRKLNQRKLVNDHILFHLNPDIFKCDICDRVYNSRKMVLHHKYVHRASEKRKFVCDICGNDFALKHHLADHIRNVHAFKMKIACRLCSLSFPSQDVLNAHIKLKHSISFKTKSECQNEPTITPAQKKQILAEYFDLSCNICQKNMESVEEVQAHFIEQHNQTDGNVKCCNMIMKTKYRKFIDDHIAWHLNPKYFTCEVCDKSFMLRRALSIHMKRHRSFEKRLYVCSGCKKAFGRESELKEHSVHCIKRDTEINCEYCKKCFLSIDKLMAHIKIIHVPELEAERKETELNKLISAHFDMICDVCTASLESLKHAKSHYKTVHNSPDGYLKCCGLKFNETALIRDHVRWHLNPDIFKCVMCGQDMKTRKHFHSHTYSHRGAAGNFKFICDICNRKFAKKQLLKRHLQEVHVAKMLKKTVCGICGKSFRTAHLLSAHYRLTHTSNTENGADKKPVVLKTVTPEERNQFIAEQFDMSCDVCKVQMESLETAKKHYINEHKIVPGYIKCCNIKLKKSSDIEEHITWHFNPEMFKCKLCGKCYKSKTTLNVHVVNHEALESNKYVCRICNARFARQRTMDNHMNRLHSDHELQSQLGLQETSLVRNDDSIVDSDNPNKDTKPSEFIVPEDFHMICHLCQCRLQSWNNTKSHFLHEHNSGDPFITCTYCDVRIKLPSEIPDHIAFHSNPATFQCGKCHKNCKSKHHLNRHLASHDYKYECKVCKKKYRARSGLNSHQIIHETERSIFQCELCKKSFPYEMNLKTHMRRNHNPNDSQICDICAKVCKSKSLLQSHLRTHSDAPPRLMEKAQCNMCGAWLSNRYTLASHIARHNSTPQKCDQCDKVAPNLDALKMHVKSVHVDASFKCQFCDKMFKRAASLKDHVATHTGEKLYKCLYCPDSFIWKPNCYSHQKKAHPREWSDDQLKKTEAKSQRKTI